MKRLILTLTIVACGSTTNGTDGGPSDAAGDTTSPTDGSSDAADGGTMNDGASNDALMMGDGSLGAGQNCDPNDNLCEAGLLCCSEPTHMGGDAATAYFCEHPVNKGCPMLP